MPCYNRQKERNNEQHEAEEGRERGLELAFEKLGISMP
jgi:hypothetical protein